MSVLNVQGLVKSFRSDTGHGVAVDNVSFEAREGEFFTLLGPSGCGKTTTLRSVAGLESPDAGEIVIQGTTVYSGARAVDLPSNKRPIAMVFQSYAIWPHMSVFENVAFPLRAMGASVNDIAPRVGKMLDMVGLGAFAKRSATQLSGGQQQRVALARAMIKDPALLLLDEPLSNLDAQLRVEMRRELIELGDRRPITMLYVTHDQAEALALSDRIAVMRAGKIVEIGDPDSLYFRPKTAFIANLVGQTNSLPGVVTGTDGGHASVETGLGPVDCGVVSPHLTKSATVIIRPEHLSVRPAAGDAQTRNHARGKVAKRVFSGRFVELEIHAGSLVLQAVVDAGNPCRRGDVVDIGLPQSYCIAVPDTD
ncbi:MAG: ABC transporter ATP-binding protein [Devosia sp.]|nr:ABC transporter ATP-binding protein [Devosia sp.]